MQESNKSVNEVIAPLFVVDNVTKTYEIKAGSRAKGLFKKSTGPKNVRALKGVSLFAQPGDFVGLLGQNGSGKSTMLRLLAGQEPPTTGQVLTTSRPQLLGITAALQTYLTGEQNITLGCLALGMSPEEVEEARPKIEALAEIGDAIYRPMQTYSAGMAGRLKFAISTSISPEILLVDEALSAGDASFAERAKQRIDGLLDSAGAVVLVSHSTGQIEKMCNRAAWLHEGRMIADGDVKTVTAAYKKWADFKARGDQNAAKKVIHEIKHAHPSRKVVHV